jgi:hypothetical protein
MDSQQLRRNCNKECKTTPSLLDGGQAAEQPFSISQDKPRCHACHNVTTTTFKQPNLALKCAIKSHHTTFGGRLMCQ